jgi:hypothetical protein
MNIEPFLARELQNVRAIAGDDHAIEPLADAGMIEGI